MPRMFYISKIDEENSDYYNSLHKLQKQFGVSVAPIVVPILKATAIPLVLWTALSARRTAWKATSVSEIPIPDNMKDRVDQHRAALWREHRRAV